MEEGERKKGEGKILKPFREGERKEKKGGAPIWKRGKGGGENLGNWISLTGRMAPRGKGKETDIEPEKEKRGREGGLSFRVLPGGGKRAIVFKKGASLGEGLAPIFLSLGGKREREKRGSGFRKEEGVR